MCLKLVSSGICHVDNIGCVCCTPLPRPGEGTCFEAAAHIAGADAGCVPSAVHALQRWHDPSCSLLRGTQQECDAGVPTASTWLWLDEPRLQLDVPWEQLPHPPAQATADPSSTWALRCCPNQSYGQALLRSCSVAHYHVWVFLSQPMTQMFVPGTCLHSRSRSRGSSRWPCSAPSVCLILSPAPMVLPSTLVVLRPLLWSWGPARHGFSFQSCSFLDWCRARQSPAKGCAQAHMKAAAEPGVLLQAGHLRLLHPPVAGSAAAPFLTSP